MPVVIGACDHARIIEAISHDRKAVGSFVKFILPVEIGRTVINDQITVDTINRVLEEK